MRPHHEIHVYEKGSALIVVIVITLLLSLMATYLFNSAKSQSKQSQAQENHAVTSDRAEAAIQSATIWLDSLNDPPEFDANFVSDCTNCYEQITHKREEEIAQLDEAEFYRTDENGDGNIDETDYARFLIVPIGVSAAGNCIANDGYGASCWRTHSYLIIARAQLGLNTKVERKQEFKRQFYY